MMPELTSHQKEALDIGNHISLTANAGSGKTFVLAKRFVEILLTGQVELSNVVAITFTDKAAGELNKKLPAKLNSGFFLKQITLKGANLKTPAVSLSLQTFLQYIHFASIF